MRAIALITRGGLAAATLLLCALAVAASNIDLTDFDDDVMKNMDDTVKSLDSDLATHDPKAAQTDAGAIREGLHRAEEYFARKGNVDDAVQLAKQGEEFAINIAKSAGSSDFEAALNTYDALVKTCRRCHDVYKPPEL
jgi:hypothetical protein